jgi:hypothetical protein
MKLLHITFHFEFTEPVEAILDRHEIRDYVRIPMVAGHDSEGKHEGSQVHPGNVTLIQAQAPDETVDDVMNDLEQFRRARRTHEHLQAVVVSIERRLEDEQDD